MYSYSASLDAAASVHRRERLAGAGPAEALPPVPRLHPQRARRRRRGGRALPGGRVALGDGVRRVRDHHHRPAAARRAQRRPRGASPASLPASASCSPSTTTHYTQLQLKFQLQLHSSISCLARPSLARSASSATPTALLYSSLLCSALDSTDLREPFGEEAGPCVVLTLCTSSRAESSDRD